MKEIYYWFIITALLADRNRACEILAPKIFSKAGIATAWSLATLVDTFYM